MSSTNVKVRLKVASNEIEIEGSIIDIERAISLIPDMIKSLPDEIMENSVNKSESNKYTNSNRLDNYSLSQNASSSKMSEFPEINIERGDSLSSIITKLFTDQWGKTPRKLNNVREALQSYGQVYPKQSVAVSLLRMAQSGRLRRFKGEKGEFVYTASNLLSTEDIGSINNIQN
jgi:hypothetical protein